MLLQRQMVMKMLLAAMLMPVNMYKIISLEEWPVIQHRFRSSPSDYLFVSAEHINRFCYLPDNMQIVRSGNYGFSSLVGIDNKINNVSNR